MRINILYIYAPFFFASFVLKKCQILALTNNILLFFTAHCASVEPIPMTKCATVNTTVKLTWKVKLEPSEGIIYIKLHKFPDDETNIVTYASQKLTVNIKGRKLFGNRLSANYSKHYENVTLTLQNIKYNENVTFSFVARFFPGFVLGTGTITIKCVTGMLFYWHAEIQTTSVANL